MRETRRCVRHGLLILSMFLFALALPAPASAQDDRCALTIRVVSQDGSEPVVPLTLVVLHSGGIKQTFDLPARSGPIELPSIDCKPASAMAFLAPLPHQWAAFEPIRLARNRHRFSDGQPVADLVLSIPDIRRIFCRVVDESGEPVAGGNVSLSQDNLVARQSPGAGSQILEDGTGEIWAAPGEPLIEYRSDWVPGAPPHSVNGVSSDSGPLRIGTQDLEVVFVVPQPPKTHLVKGRVVDPDGESIEGVRIVNSIRGMRDSLSDSDGRFFIRAKPGSETLTLNAEDRTGNWVFPPVSFDLTTESEEFDWEATPWPGSKVTVRTVSGDTGEPLSGVGVSAQLGCLEDSPARKYVDVTGASGEVRVPCSETCPGRVFFDLRRSEHQDYFLRSNSEEVPDGLCDGIWEVPLDRGASLSTTIVDTDGFPVSGLPITLNPPSGLPLAKGTTDENGNFRFQPLEPGRYRIQIESILGSEPESMMILGDGFESKYFEVGHQDRVEARLTARIGGPICVGPIEAGDNGEKILPGLMIVSSAAPKASVRAKRIFNLIPELGELELACTSGLAPGDYRFLAISENPLVFAPTWTPTVSLESLASHEVAAGERTVVPALAGGTLGGGLKIELDRYPEGFPILLEMELAVADENGETFGPWVLVPQERILYLPDPQREYSALFAALIPKGRYRVRLRIQGEGDEAPSEWFLRGSVLLDADDGVSVTLEEKP